MFTVETHYISIRDLHSVAWVSGLALLGTCTQWPGYQVWLHEALGIVAGGDGSLTTVVHFPEMDG